MSEWPLVHTRIVEPRTETGMRDYIDAVTLLLAGEVPYSSVFAVVADVSGWSTTAVERRTLSAFYERESPRIRARVAAYAAVSSSALASGMVNAITWLAGTPAPFLMTTSRVEAVSFARSHLAARLGGERRPIAR